MERQFQINWSAIVEEAKQKRKDQRLTQKRLATLAGVSTPTISRFEGGEKGVQLSSIMNILTVLGMVDERHLIFPEPKERYNFDRDVVQFIGNDDEKSVRCAISREAIEDHFRGDNEGSLKIFIANRKRIEHEARRKYLANRLEDDGSILIRTSDL
jgi:transcriptional regulator with XRE-family HTH domain